MKTFFQYALAALALTLAASTPLSATAVPIGCDEDVTASISANGEVDEYTFTGQIGDRIIIRMQGEINLDPKIDLYGPTGALLTIAMNSSNGLARIDYSLSANGTYTIRVSDVGNNDTGNYGLSLQFLKTSCAAPIGCTDDLDGTLSKMAEMDCYWFDAQAGETVIARMQGAVNVDAAIELYGPNGYFQQNLNASNGLARLGALQLPSIGTYFLVVMDDEGSDTEAYGLSLQILKTACATPIACDADLNGTLSKMAQMNCYYFSGQTGETVIARMQGAVNVDAAIELYGPNGLVDDALNASNGLARLGALQLPSTGTYFLVVMDDEGSDVEDYGLSLQFLKTSCAAPIGCTDDLDGQLGKMAEMDCYWFDAQAGEAIIARMQGAVNVDAAIELYGPNGYFQQHLNASNGLARIGALQLPTNGTYFLVVMDDEGSDVEDYGLSLQFLKTSCATAIGCTDDLDGTLSKMAQMNCYYFSGQVGETVIARMQGAVNVDAAIELYGPNGYFQQNLNASNGLARLGALQLPSTGTYFLVVMDDEGSDVEDYGLSLQFLKTSCATSIGCTDDLDGTLSKMAEMDCYWFDAQAGETVIARMQGAVNVDAAIELYGPNGYFQQNLNASNGLARLGTLQLPATGTYFLVVMDDEGSDIEDYGLSLQFLKTSCATAIGCTDDLDGQVGKMAKMDCYYFSGQTGETVIARMQGAVNVDAAIELYGPNGYFQQNLNASNGLARLGALQLPSTGTYFLVVMDDEGSDTEAYGLSLQILKTACATPIACDADLNGQVSKMAEMDCHWFNAQAGERLIIWMQGEVNLDAAIELYGPNGYFQQDINASNGLASLGVLQLPADGTYFLVVMDDEGSDTDAYGVSLQMLKTTCTQWLGCGGDAGAAIDKPAEMDAYTFSAQAGQKVIVRSNETGFGFDPEIKMYRLGDPQFEYTFNVNSSLRETYTIPASATDTFFLVYRDNTGDGAGAYGLSVQVLDPGCAAPLTCLQDTTSTLGHLSKTDAYRISGLAGQKVILRAFAPTFAEVVEIYNASGQIVTMFEAGTSGLTELLWTIPASGDYLVLLLDKTGNQTGNYGFSCQFIDLACADDAPACGASFSTTIDKLAQVRAYDISIPAGHRVVVRGVPAQTGLDLHFELFNTVTGGSYGTADLANGQVRIDRQNTVMPESLLLLVTDNNGDETGGFYLSVQKIGGQVNCGAGISCADGNTAAVPISLPGEMKAVRFLAVNGEQGILRLGAESGNAVARGELYAPDGSSIGTSQSGATVRFDYGPVQPGVYTLLVMSNSSTGTGSIAVARAPKNVFNCGTTVQYNTNLLSNLANRVNMTSFELNAGAGDVVVCQAKGAVFTFDTDIEIYRNGVLVDQDIATNTLARLDTLKIANSGFYKIIVMENQGAEAGNFGFSLQKVNPGVNTIPLPVSGFITETLDYPAASRVYHFLGNTGNVVSFTMNEIVPGISPRIELYTPSGKWVKRMQGNTTASVTNFPLPETGTYTVLAMDDSGVGTGSYEIGNLQIVTPPTAGFTFGVGAGCTPLTVQFANASSANATSFSWSFPGGTPSTSTQQNPIVTYNTPGTYSVTLTVSNVAGSATAVQSNIIHAEAPPVPSFGFSANGLTVSFDNNSTNANSYMWDFGDGQMSGEFEPTHTYPASGTYTVTLTAKNDFCEKTTQLQIMVMTIGTNDVGWVETFNLFPNPNNGIFTVSLTGTPTEQLDFELFDLAGKTLRKQSFKFGTGELARTFDFGGLPAAMYLLRVRAKERVFYAKVVVE